MLKKSHIAVLVAGAFFAAQTGAMWLDESYSDSQEVTVFNQDGSSYTIIPDVDVAALEPTSDALIVATAEPVATAESVAIVAVAEPVAVVAMVQDISVDPVDKRDYRTIEENHRLNVDHL